VISTSEIKVSVLIAEEYVELAVRALHSAYELGRRPDRRALDPLGSSQYKQHARTFASSALLGAFMTDTVVPARAFGTRGEPLFSISTMALCFAAVAFIGFTPHLLGRRWRKAPSRRRQSIICMG